MMSAADVVDILVHPANQPDQVLKLSATIDSTSQPGHNVYHEWESSETLALPVGICHGYVRITGPGNTKYHVPTGSFFSFSVAPAGPDIE